MLELNIKAKNNRPKKSEYDPFMDDIGIFINVSEEMWIKWGCEDGKIVNGWNGKQYQYLIDIDGKKGYARIAWT